MLIFTLPCKPYVRHYLKLCFGEPANMRHDSEIGKYFFRLLSDPTERYDKRINLDLDFRSSIDIKITQDVFLRKGCILTKTNINEFNLFVEGHFKDKIRIMIDTLVQFQGIKIQDAVDLVYEKYDMDEDVFSLDAIIKDYQRYRKRTEAL